MVIIKNVSVFSGLVFSLVLFLFLSWKFELEHVLLSEGRLSIVLPV